ncbi:VWA domain-containing protein [Pseudohoeflea suaedae]|uniref:VWA domain-containing protein n=1 Tax=Pseudohoeflea suaedae TaxID=877384 RepID=A0A4R5PQC1_9HYPH|nr:PAN domain-containing protein [Pseudohoeflea suaedae]TDH39148.1 VWA domain-containing protein [Pseudohoeflea suaedae]
MIRTLIVSLAALCAALLFMPQAARANARAVIVLDASGSMWGQIDGRTKIEIARETLANVLETLPADLDLGLVAYGHREKGNCSDIEEIVAPGPDSRRSIREAVGRINPKGKTPIADSVKAAAQALRFTEEKATVIVITDGIETCSADPCALATELDRMGVDFTAHVIGFGLTEDEGRQVACLAENTGGRYLQARNADELSGALVETVAAAPEPAVTLDEGMEGGIDRPGSDLDSLDLAEPDPALCRTACLDNAQCVAWTFVKPGIQADNARCWLKRPAPEKVENNCCVSGVMSERLAMIDNVKIRVLLAEGAADYDLNGRWDVFAIEDGAPASSSIEGGYGTEVTTTLAPGRYRLTYSKDMVSKDIELDVKPGERIDRDLVLDAGVVTVRVLPDDGAETDPSGRFDLENKNARDGGYGEGTKIVPAGEVRISASLGKAEIEETFALEPGETVRKDMVLGIGILKIDAVYAEGGPQADASGLRVDVMSAKKSLDGKRRHIDGGYGPGNRFKLPPGDYMVTASLGNAAVEQAVTVTRGEMTEAVANLDAGVLFVTAPGAYRIDIFEAKADLEGKRRQIDGAYGEEFQTVLHPGDYIAVATMGDSQGLKRERPATVAAAEREEVTID